METVESVQGLVYWHWLSFGLLMLVIEVAFAGGTYLMWLGFAALATGIAAWLLPGVLVWQAQLVLFGLLSVASVLLWKRYAKDPATVNAPVLNQRGLHYIGRVVSLEDAIVGGNGRVRIDDTLWMVRGADAPAGTRVKIVAQDGNILEVEPAA